MGRNRSIRRKTEDFLLQNGDALSARRALVRATSRALQSDGLLREAIKQQEQLERALQAALDIKAGTRAKPLGRVARGSGSKDAVACVVASDWHVEEIVKPSHVNGMNEYSPAIATKRAATFAQGVLWLLEQSQHDTNITEILLAAIGDFITGWIHEENMAGNAMPPTEAAIFAGELLCGVIRELLKRTKMHIRIVCSRGNHGRITQRSYINAVQTLSFEWMMYKTVALIFADEPRVSMVIGEGYHTYQQVYDKLLRLHHGDAVKFKGGIGGLTIPLLKKIHQWNTAQRSYLDVIGHFHQLMWGGPFVVNGSLIGYNDYANWIGVNKEPPQQAFFLIRPLRGIASFSPIFVE